MFEPETTDVRSDLFSLAAVAYFALTRRTPFDAESIEGLYFAIDGGTFARPSELRPGATGCARPLVREGARARSAGSLRQRATDGGRALRCRARGAHARRRDDRGRGRRAGVDAVIRRSRSSPSRFVACAARARAPSPRSSSRPPPAWSSGAAAGPSSRRRTRRRDRSARRRRPPTWCIRPRPTSPASARSRPSPDGSADRRDARVEACRAGPRQATPRHRRRRRRPNPRPRNRGRCSRRRRQAQYSVGFP